MVRKEVSCHGRALTLPSRVPCLLMFAFQGLDCVALVVLHFGQEIHCRKIPPSQASAVKPINDFQSLVPALKGSVFMRYSDPSSSLSLSASFLLL